MNILEIIEKETGLIFKKKAATKGGEFAGPCPWCGGDDRFGAYPGMDHYVCRQCKKNGDSIEFVKDFLKKTYLDACKYLGVQPGCKFSSLNVFTEQPGQNEIEWKPREIVIPTEQWQQKATAILFQAYKYLLSSKGKLQRDILNARGISTETIKKARLGYISSAMSFDITSWGLPSETSFNKKMPSVWLPQGVIVPQFHDGKLVAMRIRQDNPEALTRFIMVKGSATGYLSCSGNLSVKKNKALPWIVTESELDAWAIFDHADGAVNVFAIGNSTARPDIGTHEYLKNHPGLVNLDNDSAGHEEWAWWESRYPQAVPWYSENGKDPGEDFNACIDLKKWLAKGLKQIGSEPAAKKTHSIFDIDLKAKGKGAAALVRVEKAADEFGEDSIENESADISIDTVSAKEYFLHSGKKIRIQSDLNTVKKCVHGAFCVSLKGMECLAGKLNPFESSACPKMKWWLSGAGTVQYVIKGFV